MPSASLFVFDSVGRFERAGRIGSVLVMAAAFLSAAVLGCSTQISLPPPDLPQSQGGGSPNETIPATVAPVPPTQVIGEVETVSTQVAPPAAESGHTGPPNPSVGHLGLPPANVRVLTELPSAPERDLFQLAYELLLPPGHSTVPEVVNESPVAFKAGRTDVFNLVDLDGLEKYQSIFELRYVSPNAYWYFEEGIRVEQDEIERAAAEFEGSVYPRVTGYFGTEWKPGVDNDPHLTIVHGDIKGAGGYFSSTDEYPEAVRPGSNQREMIYINARYLRVGSPSYYRVLAHELSHAVMWRHDASEDTWVNEGLAELSVTVAGYPPDSISSYLRRPFVSLVHWPLDDANIGAHYGGASLFMHYLFEHYSGPGRTGLPELMAIPEDGQEGIDNYLDVVGYERDFHSILADWVVANFLDEEGGSLGYRELAVEIQPTRRLNRAGRIERQMDQYGTHYIELGSRLRDETLHFAFEGQGHNRIIPVEVPAGGCWWSNNGDSIASTLTGVVDLTGASQATLSYDAWYKIEEEWDYVYLQVSADAGKHWDILETRNTSAANPIGVAFGPGYTGESDGWVSEEVDLSSYSGQPLQVRFQYVTDDALNDAGMCLKKLTFNGDGVLPAHSGWTGNGFVMIDNVVRQEFIAQVIQKGDTNRVVRIPLHRNAFGAWEGEIFLEPYQGLERTMVAITPTAPATRERAGYVLEVSEASP